MIVPPQSVSSSQFSYYIQNNIPAGTYIFSTGNSSSDPNAIAYVGVNYLTNTVYLINSSGQIYKYLRVYYFVYSKRIVKMKLIEVELS